LLAEQREASRMGRSSLATTSLDSGNFTPPWLNFDERRRSTSNRPSSVLRPAPSSDRRVAPFDDAHFWDDTESDRNSGHTAQNDTWTSAEHYPRSTRADISQRLERLIDDTNDGHEPTRPLLVRSQTTTTSTLATFNRLRNRLHHNSSATRLASFPCDGELVRVSSAQRSAGMDGTLIKA
jgi:hypothetical protein